MLYLIILLLLTVLLYLWVDKILYGNFVKIHNDCERMRGECARLYQEGQSLKEENIVLEKNTEDTVALYEITKDICKSLDADKVFSLFRDQLDRYIKISDCKFLKGDVDLSPYKGYTIFPLNIDSSSMGYLVAEGISDQDRDKFYILAHQFILGIKRALLYQKVQELAITDSLTQVFSRRYCLERFREELVRSKKMGFDFSCLMVDIDHFKEYNDRFGHLVGDAILRNVARAIKDNIRQIDLIGRYGGEEFLIILAETEKDEALSVAERIRLDIEHRHIRVYDEELRVTISLGISTFPIHGQDAQGLIDKADQALYEAKRLGRNRVCVQGAHK